MYDTRTFLAPSFFAGTLSHVNQNTATWITCFHEIVARYFLIKPIRFLIRSSTFNAVHLLA